MTPSLFRRTRPIDLDREIADLRQARADLPRERLVARKAFTTMIRSRERLRRRLSVGLPAA